MANHLFILGAGASAAAGAPLMRNFLDVAEDLMTAGHVSDSVDHFSNVFKAIAAMQSTSAKGFIDTRNLESVFTAFEMAKLLCCLPGFDSAGACEDLVKSMRILIVRTLEETAVVDVSGGGSIEVPAYTPFAKSIKALVDAGNDVSIVTFNYDCALEYALYHAGVAFAYGLSDDPQESPAKRVVKVLKLHGSLNWFAEDDGSVKQMRVFGSWEASKLYRDRWVGQRLKANRNAIPVIVPPTFGKSEFYAQIKQIWSSAAASLAPAQNVFVIGYSLPPTDEFFRNLWSIGSIGPARIRRFCVFDRSAPDDLDKRYRSLLGRQTEGVYSLYRADFERIASKLGGGGDVESRAGVCERVV